VGLTQIRLEWSLLSPSASTSWAAILDVAGGDSTLGPVLYLYAPEESLLWLRLACDSPA